MFTWFYTRHDPASDRHLDGAEQERLAALLAATPGLGRGLLYTPASTHDPYLDDGRPPQLAVQLYFPDIAALEAALAPHGHLQGLADPALMPSLAGVPADQQAMVVRRFPVPDPTFRTPPGSLPCTYLVGYPGPAEDLNVWLSHYVTSHPPVMARFPAIRQIEIYSRLDWCGFLPVPRAEWMQRNKVVFDDADALTAALNSPTRDEMREDFRAFPPFSGGNTHFPMATRTVKG